MKVKTTELAGAALDWAVAKCEQLESVDYVFEPSTDWEQGGHIIEREEINLLKRDDRPWSGYAYRYGKHKKLRGQRGCEIFRATGPTPLIAAMRCYVASKLGDEVDVPEELLA